MFLGREVYIRGNYGSSKFDLITEGDSGERYTAKVSLTKETRGMLPKIIGKEKHLVEPAGWFSSAKYSYTLSLSDGTTWDLDGSNSSLHNCLLPDDKMWNLDEAGAKKVAMDAIESWRVGDRFLVSKCPYEKKSFFLVNIDFHYYEYRSVVYCD